MARNGSSLADRLADDTGNLRPGWADVIADIEPQRVRRPRNQPRIVNRQERRTSSWLIGVLVLIGLIAAVMVFSGRNDDLAGSAIFSFEIKEEDGQVIKKQGDLKKAVFNQELSKIVLPENKTFEPVEINKESISDAHKSRKRAQEKQRAAAAKEQTEKEREITDLLMELKQLQEETRREVEREEGAIYSKRHSRQGSRADIPEIQSRITYKPIYRNRIFELEIEGPS